MLRYVIDEERDSRTQVSAWELCRSAGHSLQCDYKFKIRNLDAQPDEN